jgi:hypothetical protein
MPDALRSPADSSVSAIDADDLLEEVGRLSRLSSDLRDCLQGLIRKINDATDTLNGLLQSIDLKKAELKRMYDIEASADALKKLEEEQSFLRKKRKEEMEASEREILGRRKTIEAELDRRERVLVERELECNRLVRELELLITRLANRTGGYRLRASNDQG